MAEHTVRLVNNSLTFQTYWQVGMSCEGCAKAVKGVMGKTEGTNRRKALRIFSSRLTVNQPRCYLLRNGRRQQESESRWYC